jgi:quinol monooxygenase YgiN
MYVVTASFQIDPKFSSAFREQMIGNARMSRGAEPGCLQFDVCTDPMHKDRIFLYEVYADRAAFDAHLLTAHYKSFEETAGPWITAKDVRTYERIDPA